MSCVVSSKKKLFITIQAVILFLVFSSPMTYKVMRKVLGPMISTFEGLPHPTGILLHALLFGIVTYLLMGAGSSYSKKAVGGGSSMKNIMGLNLYSGPVQEDTGAASIQGTGGSSAVQGSNLMPKSIH
jgi:hypothetical protein